MSGKTGTPRYDNRKFIDEDVASTLVHVVRDGSRLIANGIFGEANKGMAVNETRRST